MSSCQTKAKGLQTSETGKKGWRHIQLTSSAQDFKGRSCGYLDGDLVSDRHTTPYGPPQHEIQGHPRLGVMQPWYAKRQAQTWYDDILMTSCMAMLAMLLPLAFPSERSNTCLTPALLSNEKYGLKRDTPITPQLTRLITKHEDLQEHLVAFQPSTLEVNPEEMKYVMS